jgi:hypothetical protein
MEAAPAAPRAGRWLRQDDLTSMGSVSCSGCCSRLDACLKKVLPHVHGGWDQLVEVSTAAQAPVGWADAAAPAAWSTAAAISACCAAPSHTRITLVRLCCIIVPACASRTHLTSQPELPLGVRQRPASLQLKHIKIGMRANEWQPADQAWVRARPDGQLPLKVGRRRRESFLSTLGDGAGIRRAMPPGCHSPRVIQPSDVPRLAAGCILCQKLSNQWLARGSITLGGDPKVFQPGLGSWWWMTILSASKS